MDFSNFIFVKAEGPNPPFIQIQIQTKDPLLWVNKTRLVLAYLLESFQENQVENGANIRAFGVRLFSYLYPLPAQFEAFSTDCGYPINCPPYNQTGGFYLTDWGLQLRYESPATVEEVQNFSRSIFALSLFSAYDVSAEYREHLFSMLRAFTPNLHALSLITDLPEHENQILSQLKREVGNVSLLDYCLTEPRDILNSRFFKAFAYLSSVERFTDEMPVLLDLLVTGSLENE